LFPERPDFAAKLASAQKSKVTCLKDEKKLCDSSSGKIGEAFGKILTFYMGSSGQSASYEVS